MVIGRGFSEVFLAVGNTNWEFLIKYLVCNFLSLLYLNFNLSTFNLSNFNLGNFVVLIGIRYRNRPRSIYQYSSMAPRLSGQNCKFLKFPLSLNSQKRLRYKENTTKYRGLTWKPRSHVRILIYRTGLLERFRSYSDIQRSLQKLPTGMTVASALWRRSFWKHNQAYRRLIWRMQRCIHWSVPRTTVCTVRDLVIASWRKETKYTASTHGNELKEGNQEGKTTKDTM